jgi:hypothetical protein
MASFVPSPIAFGVDREVGEKSKNSTKEMKEISQLKEISQ